MGQSLNINQEGMLPVPGQVDIQTMQSGRITCVVDATQATALKPGQFVKFYSSNTGPYPMVVAAGQTDEAHGMVAYISKQASFAAGDKVEIVFFGGAVIFVKATAVAITPGTQLESDSTGLLVQAYSSGSNLVRGYALDYFAASAVARMIQLGVKRSL